MTGYNREILVEVLTFHQTISGPPPFSFTCACGWRELGHSHVGHVADVYEASYTARKDTT